MENHGAPVELTDEQLAAVFGGQEDQAREVCAEEAMMASEFAL
ncbi:hypothetical protein ACFPM7_15610 [Actinokineospora guangxiensis]|jgi:hypothetical protein|uniref:Bacteriocin-like protein n=1 Tax=Actinokineospora guangxiensis TaxID=1490288 RepID=A0ABW0ENS0_9PSEU